MNFFKRFILIDVIIVLLLCFFIVFFFISKLAHTINSQPSSISTSPIISKVWQMTFSFNPQTQQLFVKNIKIQKGISNVSHSNSGYSLLVLDQNQSILYRTNIVIAQQILYDVYFPPGSTPSAFPQLKSLESLVT